MTMRANGWIPDRPDHRDLRYSALRPQNRLFKAVTRPRSRYLHEDNLPRIYNQGNIGSCVGHGVTEACAYVLDYLYARNDGTKPGDYSRLFAYYNARVHKNEDEGAYIRDGVKAIAKYGICEESYWPYVESKFAVQPPLGAYQAAAHRANNVAYYRIDTLGDMLDCLAQGFPIVYGMMLFESFYDVGHDGVMKMPKSSDAPIGGHCMLMVGYSMPRRAFYVRNSWGIDWGNNGHVWVPFDYITQHADDFWTIRRLDK